MKTTRNTFWNVLLGGLFLVAFSSCSEEDILPQHPEISGYEQLFRNEAAQRGIDVDFRLEIEWTTDAEVNGTARRSKIGNKVIVKLNRENWAAYSEYPGRQEYLMMHELGHGVLGRGHNEHDSFMNYSTWEIADYHDEVNGENGYQVRESYFDELFGTQGSGGRPRTNIK